MESVELFDIEGYEVKRIINVIPVYWYRWKALNEPSLVPVLRKFGKRDNLEFGVHIFVCGKMGIITILSEYLTDLKTVTFEILATSLSDWTGPKDNEQVEVLISEFIETILQDEFASPIQVFVCPECQAAYIINKDQDVKKGILECPYCDKSVKFEKNLVPPDI
ncbi:hypothetical protein EU527_19425 [Candidatus Thorarchaeota archaeon]|nr:MAG: hypothetical protein EU527_19425 [Candidatus Thorarchaeota archaeon]